MESVNRCKYALGMMILDAMKESAMNVKVMLDVVSKSPRNVGRADVLTDRSAIPTEGASESSTPTESSWHPVTRNGHASPMKIRPVIVFHSMNVESVWTAKLCRKKYAIVTLKMLPRRMAVTDVQMRVMSVLYHPFPHEESSHHPMNVPVFSKTCAKV